MEHHDQAGNFSLYLRQKYWHVEVTYYVSEIWRDEQTQIISCVVVVINGVNKTKTITARSQSQSLVMLNVLCLFILYSSTIYLDKKLFTDFLHLMHSHNTTYFDGIPNIEVTKNTHICKHIKYTYQQVFSNTFHF